MWPKKMLMWTTLVTLFLQVTSLSDVVVNTYNGPVLGSEKTVNGSKVLVFQGIPYAEPPVGVWRFRKPLPRRVWKGVLNATVNGASCIQNLDNMTKSHLVNTNVSEDCLFLNIYVPDKIDKSSLKSVMVWIHGGAYTTGTGSIYNAELLAVTGGTVVVTINYRLSVFGFLATNGLPGNVGLWDQVLALKWVQSNILEFGGDREKVTIFGESAGGSSVSQLALSPETKWLFQRVISESGVLVSPWAWARQQKDAVSEMAKILKCPDNDYLIICLQKRDALSIFNASQAARFQKESNFMGNPFAPVVDGKFFPESPIVTLQQKSSPSYDRFMSLDYMAGTLNAEGGLVILGLTSPQTPFDVTKGVPTPYVVKNVIPNELTYFYKNNSAKLQDSIVEVYAADPKADLITQGRQLEDLYGDLMFVAPTVKLLRDHSNSSKPQKGKTYQYYFTHAPSRHILPTLPWIQGANHGDELPYVFFGLSPLTPGEQKLSLAMMRYWTNFAKTGNPNDASQVQWPEFSASKTAYLELGDTIQSKTNLLPKRMRLWLQDIGLPDL